MRTLLTVAFGIVLGLIFEWQSNRATRLEVENECLRAENADLLLWIEVTQPKMEALDKTFQSAIVNTDQVIWTLDHRTGSAQSSDPQHTYVGGPKERTTCGNPTLQAEALHGAK